MQLVNLISRFLVGGLFIFSGLVKLNDPYGTAYKLEEYFRVFASDFGSFFEIFIPLSLALSIFVCALEVILGIAMLLSYRMRITMWITLLLIVFFTFLTFYSYWFDKVKECGCFGTFIVLTPKQSFFKDLILLVFVLILFVNRKKLISSFDSLKGDIIMLIVSAISFGIGIYSARHLPYIDNLNYKMGNHIPTLMEPEEKPVYKFILSRDGKEYEFTQENYPGPDEGYTYVRYELMNADSTKLIPKIVGLTIENDEEGNITREALTGNKLWIIIPDRKRALNNCSRSCFEEIRNLVKALDSKGVQTLVLTKFAPREEIEGFRHEVQIAAPYYFTDDVILKTMVRAHPGIMLLKDGTVKGKWHHNDTPDAAEAEKLLKE